MLSILGAGAFADFVRDARPTADDHTVLDFSMPRFAGSGFGLGQFNTNVKADNANPFLLTNRRREEYMAMSRPVTPLLTNLGTEPPEAVAARIEQRRKLPFERRFFVEDEWTKMRADGSIPSMTAAPFSRPLPKIVQPPPAP